MIETAVYNGTEPSTEELKNMKRLITQKLELVYQAPLPSPTHGIKWRPYHRDGFFYLDGIIVLMNPEQVPTLEEMNSQVFVKSSAHVNYLVKHITLHELLINLENDLKEDGDTGVHLKMTLERYLTELFPEKAEEDKE